MVKREIETFLHFFMRVIEFYGQAFFIEKVFTKFSSNNWEMLLQSEINFPNYIRFYIANKRSPIINKKKIVQ